MNSEGAIRLRPHHLLCVQRFRGLGYSDVFVENLSEVVDHVESGEPVEVVRGRDDVCSACGEDCDEESVAERDAAVLNAIPEPTLASARELSAEEMRELCRGCRWFAVCHG
ncbi:MAG: hypothetical protein MAG715_01098 [Methanonatronarchaeales archaeon]|nr:hypothetical protein [Methanonatronarchaeales archaeon]